MHHINFICKRDSEGEREPEGARERERERERESEGERALGEAPWLKS